MKTEGRYIMGGEDSGFPSVTESNQIKRLLNMVAAEIQGFTQNRMTEIRRLARIGTVLSAERNIERLLE